MFISVLELFKTCIGPSSSHTMGLMFAARDFVELAKPYLATQKNRSHFTIRCTLKGSLAYTGKGHSTYLAVVLGLYGYSPEGLINQNIDALVEHLWQISLLKLDKDVSIQFIPDDDIIFDKGTPLPQHPNGIIFDLVDSVEGVVLSETYFSIGGGFISTLTEISNVVAPLKMHTSLLSPYVFDSAEMMLQMSVDSGLSIAEMKRTNECKRVSDTQLNMVKIVAG